MALRGVLNQFTETFFRLSLLQKVSLLAATVAVFATVVVLVIWANKPIYKTLYADLAEQDVKDVSTSLDGKKIPYRVVGGNSIELTSEDIYATRIALAQEGLPKVQTTGFELFDQSKLGMTEFAQNVNYQRALQGELSRSIMAINEVVEATVHLSVPKDRIFVEEDEDSKASVVVRLLQGTSLRPDQVKAITHLVSSAVKGLRPETVQVIDTNGNLLSEFMSAENDSIYVTQTQLDQQRNIEKELEKKLQGMLARTLGADRYVAKVSVEMDFNRKEITREEFADTPVLRSQHTLEVNSRNAGTGPQGIPGVESNLAEPDLLVDNIMSEYSKSEETQNFEISKTITREEKSNGSIKRLTVSVVVDDKPVQVEAEGVRSVQMQPRTEEEIARIRTAVASAVGFSEERGDTVDVTNISFDISDTWVVEGNAEKEKIMEWVSMAMKYGSALLILLMFYLLLIRPILKRLDNAKEMDEELLGESALDAQISSLDITVGGDTGFPKTVEELEREIETELDESVPVDVEAVKSKVMLKKIEESSNEDPEMVANLVKAMIKGG
ncbi:MAG: flagellar M-ring protein FliF [Deferribacteraceae bacterium]|jgi:flagellar M-ring protein FliF|nr:flagellar M-ring protein FliF [Deferribacteraceae bacterium]